jgi:hypothetical protein
MKKLFAVFAILFLTGAAFAIEIPTNCRVANQDPGYCCWASLETLGRTHDITSLYDLVENRKKDPDNLIAYGSGPTKSYVVHPKNYGYDYALRAKLTSLKVNFWMEDTGNTDRTLLKYANSHGCLVGVKPGARSEGGHGIILTHYDDKIVRFYDCNNPNDMWEGSRQWFDFWWSGMVIVVEK